MSLVNKDFGNYAPACYQIVCSVKLKKLNSYLDSKDNRDYETFRIKNKGGIVPRIKDAKLLQTFNYS